MGPVFSVLPDAGRVLRGSLGDEEVADGSWKCIDLKNQGEEQVTKGDNECWTHNHRAC